MTSPIETVKRTNSYCSPDAAVPFNCLAATSLPLPPARRKRHNVSIVQGLRCPVQAILETTPAQFLPLLKIYE